MGAEGGRGEGRVSHIFTSKLWQQSFRQKDVIRKSQTEKAKQKKPIRKRENTSYPVAIGNGIPEEFTSIGCE